QIEGFYEGADPSKAMRGVSRTQLGAFVALGARQGALSNMGFEVLPRGQGLQLKEEDRERLESFVKESAETIRVLTDVFGSQSATDLGKAMHRFTGMRPTSDANLREARRMMQEVQTSARIAGVDEQAALMQMAETGRIAAGFGFGERGAGMIAAMAGRET